MWPRLVNGFHENRLRVIFLLQKTHVKLHGFAVNLRRLLFKRPVSRAKDSRTCFAFSSFPNRQVKEASFLTVLCCRCLTPHLSVLGGLLSILGKICGHFNFKRTFSQLVTEIRKVRNLTSHLETDLRCLKAKGVIFFVLKLPVLSAPWGWKTIRTSEISVIPTEWGKADCDTF